MVVTELRRKAKIVAVIVVPECEAKDAPKRRPTGKWSHVLSVQARGCPLVSGNKPHTVSSYSTLLTGWVVKGNERKVKFSLHILREFFLIDLFYFSDGWVQNFIYLI